MDERAENLVKEYAEIIRRKLGNRLKGIILFGSQARGDAWKGSDYDILLIVDERTQDIREASLDAGVEMMDRHETLFVSLIYSQEEWAQAQEFPFAWNVRQEGVVI